MCSKGARGLLAESLRVARETQGLIYLGSFKDSFHQCLGACPGVSTRHQGLNTFYFVHGIAKKWNLLLSKPAERRWASKKLDWKQMRFNTEIENKPAPWPFLKVKLTPPKVPARTLVKLGINSKKKKGQSLCLWNKGFFSQPSQRYILGYVAAQSLSRTTVYLRRHGHSSRHTGFLLIRDCLLLLVDGRGYKHTWNFYRTQCLSWTTFSWGFKSLLWALSDLSLATSW